MKKPKPPARKLIFASSEVEMRKATLGNPRWMAMGYQEAGPIRFDAEMGESGLAYQWWEKRQKARSLTKAKLKTK